MSLTILAFATFLTTQSNRIVDFTPPTARLAIMAAPLGKAFGKEVVVSENLRDEVIAIHATKVKVGDLMNALATSLDAQWTERDGRLILEKTKQGERHERDRELKFRTARIRTRQKEMLAELDRQGEFNEARARLVGDLIAEMTKKGGFFNGNETERLGRKTPLGRFMLRVIATIPAEEIAAIPFAQRSVYTLQPTRMQRKLRLDADAVATLRRENEVFTRAAEAMALDTKAEDAPPYVFPMALPDALQLEVRLSSSGVDVQATGRLLAQGTQICRTYIDIQPYEPLPAPGKDAEIPLELSTLALEFREVYRAGRQRTPRQVSPELRTFLERPDVNDPLSLVGGPAVRALSQSEGKPVIYLIPDTSFFGLLGIMRGSTPTLGMLRILLATEEQFDASGFLIVRPKEPITQRSEVCDRVALAEWLSKFPKGGPTCDDTMKLFAAHYETPGWFSILWGRSLYAQGFSRDANRVFGLLPNLMSALAKSQKEHLAGGGTLVYSGLSREAKSIADQMVFGLNSQLRTSRPDGRDGGEVEPTEVLPNGIPDSAKLTAKRTVSKALVGVRDQAGVGVDGLVERGTQDLGFQMSCLRRKVLTPIAAWPTRLAIVERESWYATLALAPGLSVNSQFINMFAPVSREVTLDSLPEPYRKFAAEWADYYDKHPEEPAPMMREGAYGPPVNRVQSPR